MLPSRGAHTTEPCAGERSMSPTRVHEGVGHLGRHARAWQDTSQQGVAGYDTLREDAQKHRVETDNAAL